MTPGPGASDAADHAQFLKLFTWLTIPGYILLAAGEAVARGRDWIGTATFLLLLLLNLPILYLLARLLFHFMDRSATGIAQIVLAGRGHPLGPAHSGMESLVARGFYAEAAEQFRSHLVAMPDDHGARFKLADLYRRHLADPLAAERLYLEIRNGQAAPREEMLAGNMLIELYRETGRRDRQIVELARFAERWRGTAAGRSAAQALKEMKQDPPEG